MPTNAIARQAFPRGLPPPEGGFRFGSDTLPLAAFDAPVALYAGTGSIFRPG